MSTTPLPPSGLTDARILIVDDEPSNVDVLRRILANAGYRQVRGCHEPRQALPVFHEFRPDLVLLDLHMPDLDGFEVMARLQTTLPAGSYLPILILTGDARFEARERALSAGARDFLVKPFDMTEVLLRIRNLLQTRFLHRELEGQNQQLEIKVAERTRELEEAQLEILQRLANAAEFRDDDTGHHTKRVASLAAELGRALGLDHGTLDLVRLAAPLHDVGKIGIPDHILLKPGRLEPAEFETMKSHTVIGARILGGGRSPLLQMAETIAQHHHERWDGSGYPMGVAGEAIPLAARLVAVADVHDALSHDRPYRAAWPTGRVREEIESGAGTQFDPDIAGALLRLPLRPDLG